MNEGLQGALGEPKGPLGASHYAKVRERFRNADPSARKFAPTNPDDPITPALLAAIRETQHYHRNVLPLLTQLALMGPCNQKELCGVLKFQATLSPSVSQMQWSTALSIAKYCASQGFLYKFPTEMQLARSQWDKAFVAAFESVHRDGMDIRSFVELHLVALPLVLCLGDVMLLLNRKGPWSGVRDVLGRVVSSSSIGRRMFSFAMVRIIAFGVSVAIEAQVTNALNQKCTVETINHVKLDTFSRINSMVGIGLLLEKRLVHMNYRGVAFKVTVASVFGEVDKRLAAGLKELGLAVGMLQPLFCEGALVPPGRRPTISWAPMTGRAARSWWRRRSRSASCLRRSTRRSCWMWPS